MSRLAVVALAAVSVAGIALSPAPALAQQGETRPMAETLPGYQPSAFEQNLASMEPRLAQFGAEMQALDDDAGLTDAERRDRKAALWREFGPDLLALTTSAAELGLTVAGTLLQTLDVGALVAGALAQADLAVAEASLEADAAMADAFAGLHDSWTEAAAGRDHP